MKTPRTGRNDPCPCASGKKFKHCCLGKENSTTSRHSAAGMSDTLRKALEGRQFSSLEDAQAFLNQITQQQNRRLRDEFHGLSPEQMHHVLNLPFASPRLVRFPDVLNTKPEAPVLTLFELLTDAIGEQGLKPTARGYLTCHARPAVRQHRSTGESRNIRKLTTAVSLVMLSQPLFAELGCPAGFVPDGNEILLDNTFSQGYGSFKTGIPFKFPLGQYPTDGAAFNTSAFPNTGIALITGDVDLGDEVKQIAFPGDPNPGLGLPPVPAVETWLAYNGVDKGAPTLIWEQDVKNLKPNQDYAFTAYPSNGMAPGRQATGTAAPQISFRIDNVQAGELIVVCDAGGAMDPLQGDCANEATEDSWQRLGVTLNTASKTSATLSVHDAQLFDTKFGNDFAMTLISFQQCVYPLATSISMPV